MVVRKFNYFRFFTFIAIVIAIIVAIVLAIVFTVKHFNYKKSNEYKLLTVGYSESEVETIENKLNEEQISKILTMDYNDMLVSLLNEKYFLFDNLEKYVEYKKQNKDMDFIKVVAIINTEANIDWIDEERETDTSKNELMLVNRLYGLSSDYEVEDVVDVPAKYAYSGKKLSESILEPLERLCDDARENGYTFVVSDGYRSYKEQEKLYNSYANSYGKSEADKYVARPGHSEYETGLSFDLQPYNKTFKDPKLSEEYLWLRENAYKYGFIFRFEADKEYLTGFREYTWRLRYVGEEAAYMIYNENICFEEYYAYFVRGNK